MKKTESDKLTYGSIEKILKAYNIGAGMFFRSDVEILFNRIRELENEHRSRD